MQIGDQIKYWREQRQMTQLELAAMADRSVSSIEKIEQNRRVPTPDTLNKICKVLNLTYDKIELRDNNS